MTPPLGRLRPVAFALGLTATLLAGCVGSGGYYEDDGYGTGDYGVYGADYSGWGPGYGVGPYHDDRLLDGASFDHHWNGPRGDHIPSIAGHAHFGGFHGGRGGHGGHGGGGHGGGGHGGGGHGK